MQEGITRRRWTTAEDDTIRQRYGQLPAAEVGVLIGRTENAVWLRARTLGLDKREEFHDPWTEAELDEVRRCYATEKVGLIAARLNRTPSAVSQQAITMGLTGRKRLITQSAVSDYFSEITTAEQAYILGLMTSDGNVASGKHPRVVFGLEAGDAHLVEFVRDRLCPKATLFCRPQDGFTTIQITSRQMVADLGRYGVLPRKSLILPWPADLGRELLRPFLCGHYDGDGWIYVIRDRYPGWGIGSGSRPFLVEMKEYIRESTGVVLEKIHKRRDAELYQVATTGRGAWIVDEWLHQDGFGLERKRLPERVLAQYRVA